MARLTWGATGTKTYETGTDRGVLFLMKKDGSYDEGVAWQGLTGVSQSPDGAEETPVYADNQKYLSLFSTENFKGNISAVTYPDEFEECDGSVEIATGVTVGQQTRKPFGFSYRTLIGSDTEGTLAGYKIHLVYQAKVSPSERAFETVNDTPAAITFSWDFTTTPVTPVANILPTAHLTIDSTKVPAEKLKELEDLLYGAESKMSKLPSIDEVIALVGAAPAIQQAKATTTTK